VSKASRIQEAEGNHENVVEEQGAAGSWGVSIDKVVEMEESKEEVTFTTRRELKAYDT
jgi:hypothetical protein